MPGMTGTEFLREARTLHPDAKRTLLTAYADSEAAIAAINEVGLDYYLMKPWDPPDRNLYPVLDDLLADWSARARTSFEGVRVIGSRWSPQSYDTRDFLSRNQIPYQWIDVEQDEAMRADRARRERRRPVAPAGGAAGGWHRARRAVARGAGGEGRACMPSRRGRTTTWPSSAPALPAWRARSTARRRA